MGLAVLVTRERWSIDENAGYGPAYAYGDLHGDSCGTLGLPGHIFGWPTIGKQDVKDDTKYFLSMDRWHVPEKQSITRVNTERGQMYSEVLRARYVWTKSATAIRRAYRVRSYPSGH